MEAAGKTPAALEARPEIPEYLSFYVTSFFRLSERRTFGFSSPNPISFGDIRAYLEMYPTHDVELFLHLMTEMDAEYIECRTKAKNKDKPKDG